MTCKNCGHPIEETFCAACGEKRFDEHQLSVKHFVEESFEGIIHFDNKFSRTLKPLFIKPGQLSVDYVEGRQARYMKPIPFFLVVNLLFFVLMVINNPFSLPLYNYTHYAPFTNFNTIALVQQKLTQSHLSWNTYSLLFNEEMHLSSKAFIFVLNPLYGLLCWLLFIIYKRRMIEHLVFATHFMAFVLCWFFIQFYLIVEPFALIQSYHAVPTETDFSANFDMIVGILSAVAIASYFTIACRRFYKAGTLWSVVAGLVVGVSLFFFIQLYRMLLFYKIIYLGSV